MKNRKSMWLIFCLMTVFLFVACSSTEVSDDSIADSSLSYKYEKSYDEEKELYNVHGQGFYLDTIIDINIYEDVDEEIIKGAFEVIQSSEEKYSRHLEDSEVSMINANAGIKSVEVSEETIDLIRTGYYYSDESNGKFDITIGPLIDEWQIGTENAHVPTEEAIENALSLIDYKDIEIDEVSSQVKLKKEDMILDLGGIAKGYIADEVKLYLLENGVESAVINLGGNVLTIGSKPNNDLWKIGVQNPIQNRGNILGVLQVKDLSVVSSGAYERFFVDENGKHYHHILDPETGYPADNEIEQITIVSNRSVDGDAYSTTLFLMGLEDGMTYVKNHPDIQAIIVTDDQSIYIDENLKETFELLDKDYTVYYY